MHKTMRQLLFPAWLEGRSPDDPIRIWVPGCSTGEEAYSIAIGLTQFLEKQVVRPGIQIFATDVSEANIEKARAGVYMESALGAVSPEQLERFFAKRGRVYQVFQQSGISVSSPGRTLPETRRSREWTSSVAAIY